MEDAVKAKYESLTKPGSFYDRNGGRFKGQEVMTREQELAYVRKIYFTHSQ